MLFLQLNPGVPLYPLNLVALTVTLALFYGIHLVVGFYALIVLRLMIGTERLSPGWVSLRLQTWLLTADAAGVAALMWSNLRSYSGVLSLDTSQRMAAGAAILTVCAFMFLGRGARALLVRASARAGSARASSASRWRRRWCCRSSRAGPGKLAPLVSRPLDVDAAIARPAATGRVVLIALDGGSLDFVSAAALEGRLPNFGKILDNGAAMHLATIRPTQPDPVWTTVATGKLPARTGRPVGRPLPGAGHQRSARTAADQLLRPRARALRLRHRRAAHVGVRARAAALEHPRVGGADVGRRQLAADLSRAAAPGLPGVRPVLPARCGASPSPTTPGGTRIPPRGRRLLAMQPPALFDEARAAGYRSRRRRPAASLRRELLDTLPFVTDLMYEQVAGALGETVRPDLSAVRYRELDAAGHRFLRYAMPREFGDVSPEERQRYGLVLEGAYARVDVIVGRALADAGTRRPPAGRVGLRHGAAGGRQAHARAVHRERRTCPAPTRTRRTASCSPTARPSRPGGRAGRRWSTSCPPSSTSSGLPVAHDMDGSGADRHVPPGIQRGPAGDWSF